jgi:CheY-like chemotaxis protein
VNLPPAAVLLDVDPLRVAQVLVNLLTNAAKYTEPGGKISLAARRVDHAVEISVADNGIGIDAADLEQVFAMFSQVDNPIDRAPGGLGIGLALVKGLVDLHGGTICARSEGIGRGSEFVLRLPGLVTGEAAREQAAAVPAENTARLRILIADDNRDAAQSLAMLLELNGHDVRTAHDGAEAVESVHTFGPHIAFIDIGMPVLDGYEVARRLRQHPWGAHGRLVALTGWGQDENKRRARQSGFDDHMTKPIDPEQLEPLMQGLMQPRN